MRRFARFFVASVVVSLAAAAPASAQLGSVFSDYQSDGSINACAHSKGDLQNAAGSIPNDVAQYAPDFPGAVNAALAAQGACGGSGSAAVPVVPGAGPIVPTVGGTPVTSGRIVIKRPPAPPTAEGLQATRATSASRDTGVPPLATEPGSELEVPVPLILLGLAGGLAFLGALIWGLGTAAGSDFGRLASLRHGFGEFGLRASERFEGVAERFRLRRS